VSGYDLQDVRIRTDNPDIKVWFGLQVHKWKNEDGSIKNIVEKVDYKPEMKKDNVELVTFYWHKTLDKIDFTPSYHASIVKPEKTEKDLDKLLEETKDLDKLLEEDEEEW